MRSLIAMGGIVLLCVFFMLVHSKPASAYQILTDREMSSLIGTEQGGNLRYCSVPADCAIYNCYPVTFEEITLYFKDSPITFTKCSAPGKGPGCNNNHTYKCATRKIYTDEYCLTQVDVTIAADWGCAGTPWP